MPQLAVAIASLALVAALVWFIIIVYPIQDRIPLPKAIIPLAMAVAAVLACVMLVRAGRALYSLWMVRRDSAKR